MPNEDFLKKITGDMADEIGESVYRTAASVLVNFITVKGIDHLLADNAKKKKWPFGFLRRGQDDIDIKFMLNRLTQNKQVGEAVISFALAVVLEVFPMPTIADDIRKRLAYNLRVQTYEKLEAAGLRLIPEIISFRDTAEWALKELGEKGLIDLKANIDGLNAILATNTGSSS